MKQKQLRQQGQRSRSSLLLKVFALLALLVVGKSASWAQDATFNMGRTVSEMTENGCKLSFAGGGIEDVNTTTGVTTLSTKTEDEVKTSASMTFTGKNIRYIKITFADNENTYNLKWGGAWDENINANNPVSGKGTLVLVSNSGPNNFKIINDIEKGTESTPIKKVEVYYWNDGYTATGNQTEANATKTIPNTITWENNTVDLSKINVVGTYASFGTNGKGAMLKNSAANYLSIKFDSPADLSGISYFEIDGDNVDKDENSGVFEVARFICDDGNGGTKNVDKYNNPANVDFTGVANAGQRADLAKVKEIRLYNDAREGTFSINSIKFIYQYTLTWNKSVIPTGCDAWYTIGSDATEHRDASYDIEAGKKVVFHATDTNNPDIKINGWRKAEDQPGGWLDYGDTYTIDKFTEDRTVYPEFQNCHYYKVSADAGGSAKVYENTGTKADISATKYLWTQGDIYYEATPNTGYSFTGWYEGGAATPVSTDNPYHLTSVSTGKNLTAKFKVDRQVTNVTLTTNPQNVRIGEYFTMTVGHDSGYSNVKYKWDFGSGGSDYLYGLTAGSTIEKNENTVTLMGKATKAAGYVKVSVNADGCAETSKEFWSSAVKVTAIPVPTVSQVGNRIDFSFEKDYDNGKGGIVDTYIDYYVGSKDNANRIQEGFNDQPTQKDGSATATIADATNVGSKQIAPGTKLYVKTCVKYTDPTGTTRYASSDEVEYTVAVPLPTIDVNGTEREYFTYIPDGISGDVGVVISLHGASNDYDNGRVDFNAIADNEKTTNKRFVVVYPRGLMRQLRGTERGWETYTESNTEDVEFFKAIVEELKKTYSVDMNRIYLAGFSNGGMMAYKAAHQAGDFFKAFASVGGYPVNESHLYHAGSQPTPFIHIQGKADTVFPDNTYPLSVVAHNMMYRNGASFTPAGDGNGVINPHLDNVEEDCHQAQEGGAAYYMYKVANMGHTWSYDWNNDGNDDIASTMWAFFNKDGISNNVDKTLKFRINAPNVFWEVATTEKAGSVNVGYIGFDKVNTGTSVLSYGGYTKTDDKSSTFNKDSNNKNLWHSLQFNGGINGAPHFLKLNVETQNVGGAEHENKAHYFLVKLTKTGESTPVFAKRYQAGRGAKDLYINFSALPGFNEYKLEITKSVESLEVKVHDVEFHTGRCEDLGTDEGGNQITENPVFFYDVAEILEGMKPIYQPIFGKSYDGIAKEYLPIAEIPVGEIAVGASNRPSDIPDTDKKGNPYIYKVIEDNLKISDATAMTSLPSTLITNWDGETTAKIKGNKLFNLAVSGKEDEDTDVKSKNAFILVPSTEEYTIDKVKGINISEHGRAEMPEYLNGTRGNFPTHGVIAIKLQGTLDFYLLAQNEIEYDGSDPNPARRTLKVYYTNDQLDGELKELKEWWFFGTRSENGYSDKKDNSLGALCANIRLPQLGKDGTCTVFITYEGNGQGQNFSHATEDEGKIWIKGFVIKRPDLKVTVGRTDNKYKDQKYNGENNTFCTRFGENKPYIWSFENVGFNNTKYANLGDKKLNEYDGRTYVCGGTDDSMDHLLLFSDPNVVRDGSGKLTNTEDKVQFDGRVPGQEHIEFLKASNYKMVDSDVNNRKIWDPIPSNGLKVNVTGSGWFKIRCSAPNGPVKMKVYSSTNYGTTYINLLREFVVDNRNHPASATGDEEHRWGVYTVYLKGHVNRNGNAGFWDGDYNNSYDEGAEEILRMSLYVVFDEIETAKPYEEGHPQLNIHELSWLNEEPADYVFQREEDPKLLTEWQEIKRNGETVLWWKAGNDNDNGYTMLKENGQNAYNRLGQTTTNIAAGKGVKSPFGYASTSVPTDVDPYEAYWDIAAKPVTHAHTELAYANHNQTIDPKASPEYVHIEDVTQKNTEFDIPISGSFIRICAMKNTYVIAHVLPGNIENAEHGSGTDGQAGASVYVLDETGAPIPYKPNGTGLDDDANTHGYITAMQNFNGASAGGAMSENATMRIDFAANAGKEYFICANGASISLARLEVHDWRYKPAKSSTKLELTGGQNNSSTIATAYDTKEFYRDATLGGRTLTPGKWTSIVLPFSLNEKKFEEVFGTGAKCLHFTDVRIPNKTIYLTHHYYNMIVAGRPVFVRPGSDFNNNNLNNITDVTLQAKEVINHPATNGFQFVASYDNATMNKNDLFMNDNNAIQFLNVASATYPGMRSYVKNNSGYDFTANVHNTKALFLNFDDEVEEATGIDELIAEEFGEDVIVVTKSTKVYDLNGRMVAEGKDIDRLPAGIYIVNGKKYIVK